MEMIGRVAVWGAVLFFVVAQVVRLVISTSYDVDKARRLTEQWRDAQLAVLVIVMAPYGLIGFRRGLVDYYGLWEWVSWPLAALAVLVLLMLYFLGLELDKGSSGCAVAVLLVFMICLAFFIAVVQS